MTVLFTHGSGTIAVRIAIEGLPIEIVSDPAMEKTTSDGRRRVYCLNLAGEDAARPTIDESVNIPEAMLEGSMMTLDLFETKDEALSQVFGRRPSREWWVTATVDTGDVVVLLLSTTDIAEDDVLHLGTEAMLVTGVGAGAIVVTRAYRQTTAQKHWSADGTIPYRKLTDAPERIRGRRAWLYLYSDGDDLQGDGGNGGSPVWRGTVAQEPRLTNAGLTWQLSLNSIAARLKSTLGGELGASVRIRGAYYPWAAGIFVRIIEDQTGGAIEMGARTFHGFYETLPDFCEAFTSWLAANTSAAGLASTYRCEPTEDGRWTIRAVVGTDVITIRWYIRSLSDATSTLRDGPLVSVGTVTEPYWLDTDSAGSRRFPCTYFGDPRNPALADPSLAATYPATRLYLTAPIASDVDVVRIDWSDGGHPYDVTDSDTAENSVTLRNDRLLRDRIGWHTARIGAYEYPEILPTRLVAAGDLADLRDAIVASAPAYCNRGTWPFLTADDVASWTDVVALAAREPWQQRRSWALASPVDTDELLAHEMRLLSIFPILDSSGKIGVSSLELPTSVDGLTELDDELISVQWSEMEGGGQTINTVIVDTHYDPVDDSHARNVTVRDDDAFASDHTPRELRISPKSYAAVGDDTINAESVAAAVTPVVSIFGHPHAFAGVAVDWRYFPTATLGSFVRFSAIHLPSPLTGMRPMDDVLGIVVSRRWTLGEAHGLLRLLIVGFSPRGYAPTARVDAQTDHGDDKWTLTLVNRVYGPSGSLDVEYFEVDDAVRIIEYDSESPAIVTGTVSTVDVVNLKIAVQFDATWTPGSATWNLCFGRYDDCTESQRARYAWIADSGGELDGDRAHTFGP